MNTSSLNFSTWDALKTYSTMGAVGFYIQGPLGLVGGLCLGSLIIPCIQIGFDAAYILSGQSSSVIKTAFKIITLAISLFFIYQGLGMLGMQLKVINYLMSSSFAIKVSLSGVSFALFSKYLGI